MHNLLPKGTDPMRRTTYALAAAAVLPLALAGCTEKSSAGTPATSALGADRHADEGAA